VSVSLTSLRPFVQVLATRVTSDDVEIKGLGKRKLGNIAK